MARPKRAKRKLVTVSEALKLVGLTDLQVSPDGEEVAFCRHIPRKGQKARGTSICSVSSHGAQTRQLTRGPRDGQPCWSPDGHALAFTRKPDDEAPPQILMLPRTGGEPRIVADLEDVTPEGLSFSPTGKRLGFLSPVGDDAKTKKRKQAGDDARVFLVDDKPKRLWTQSVQSGKAKPLSPDCLAVWEYDWLPDGKSAAVIYTEEPRLDALYFEPRVGLLRLSTQQIEPLWACAKAAAGIKTSPDGRHAAFTGGTQDSPYGGQAWVVDVQTGQATCLTPAVDATVEALAWLPDSKHLVLNLARGMISCLCIANIDTPGDLKVIGNGLPASVSLMRVAAGGRHAFVVAEGCAQPPEVWRVDLASDRSARLTSENSKLGKLRLGPSSVIRWPSGDDLEIEGLLTLPPGLRKGEPAPTILLVHGGPTSHFRQDMGLLPAQVLAGAGYVVLRANPRGSSGYGQAFAGANLRDWGGGDFRDLMAGLDALIEQGITDPARLGIYGGSYGGYMTAWAITQTDRFKAAVCQCGVINLSSFHAQTDVTPRFLQLHFGVSPYDDPEVFWAHSPVAHVRSVCTPTLFLHGESDVRVPIAQTYEMHWGLRHMRVDTEFVIYPREGHGVLEVPHQRDLYGRVLNWLGKYLV